MTDVFQNGVLTQDVSKGEWVVAEKLTLETDMSELDKNRRESFLEKIEGNQVIITCTDNIENTNSYFVENGICIKNEEKNF